MKRPILLAASISAALSFQPASAQNSVELSALASVEEGCTVSNADNVTIHFADPLSLDSDRQLDSAATAHGSFEIVCSGQVTQVHLTADMGQNADGGYRHLQNEGYAVERVTLRYGITLDPARATNPPMSISEAEFWGTNPELNTVFQRDIGVTPEEVTIYALIPVDPTLGMHALDLRGAPGIYTDVVTVGIHLD